MVNEFKACLYKCEAQIKAYLLLEHDVSVSKLTHRSSVLPSKKPLWDHIMNAGNKKRAAGTIHQKQKHTYVTHKGILKTRLPQIKP